MFVVVMFELRRWSADGYKAFFGRLERDEGRWACLTETAYMLEVESTFEDIERRMSDLQTELGKLVHPDDRLVLMMPASFMTGWSSQRTHLWLRDRRQQRPAT